ncbi:unnamed protein product [Gordionus sp. m RMFG-2023]
MYWIKCIIIFLTILQSGTYIAEARKVKRDRYLLTQQTEIDPKDLIRRMNRIFDPSAKPCHDFYKFACGKYERVKRQFISDSILHTYKPLKEVDIMIELKDRIQRTLRDIFFGNGSISSKGGNKDSALLEKGRKFYDSCINTGAIQNDSQGVQNIISRYIHWHSLEESAGVVGKRQKRDRDFSIINSTINRVREALNRRRRPDDDSNCRESRSLKFQNGNIVKDKCGVSFSLLGPPFNISGATYYIKHFARLLARLHGEMNLEVFFGIGSHFNPFLRQHKLYVQPPALLSVLPVMYDDLNIEEIPDKFNESEGEFSEEMHYLYNVKQIVEDILGGDRNMTYDVLMLDKKLAQIHPYDMLRDSEEVSLKTLEEFTFTNLTNYFESRFTQAGYDGMNHGNMTIMANLPFLRNVSQIVGEYLTTCEGFKTLVFYKFTHLINLLMLTRSKEYREHKTAFESRLIVNYPPNYSRQQECYQLSYALFEDFVVAKYIKEYTNTESVKQVNKMLNITRKHFIQIIENWEWLSRENKTQILKTIKDITFDVGGPEYLHDLTNIEKEYEKLTVESDSYIENYAASRKFVASQTIETIFKFPNNGTDMKYSYINYYEFKEKWTWRIQECLPRKSQSLNDDLQNSDELSETHMYPFKNFKGISKKLQKMNQQQLINMALAISEEFRNAYSCEKKSSTCQL